MFTLASSDSNTELITATLGRLGTLGNTDTLQESSLQWRNAENAYVIPQILSHPTLGMGLGSNYRPLDRRLTPL